MFVCMCTTCVPGPCRVHKRLPDPLELEILDNYESLYGFWDQKAQQMLLTHEPFLLPPRDDFYKGAFGSPSLKFWCLCWLSMFSWCIVYQWAPFGSLSHVHQGSHQCLSDKVTNRVLSSQYLSDEETLGRTMGYQVLHASVWTMDSLNTDGNSSSFPSLSFDDWVRACSFSCLLEKALWLLVSGYCLVQTTHHGPH